jgi:hypothetical protein
MLHPMTPPPMMTMRVALGTPMAIDLPPPVGWEHLIAPEQISFPDLSKSGPRLHGTRWNVCAIRLANRINMPPLAAPSGGSRNIEGPGTKQIGVPCLA